MPDGGVDPGLAGSIVATGGVLALLGKGIAWTFGKRKSRMRQLEDRVDALSVVHEQVGCLANCCVVLIEEVQSIKPDSRAVEVVKVMIGQQWPDLYRRVFRVDPHVPPDMNDLLRRINETGR